MDVNFQKNRKQKKNKPPKPCLLFLNAQRKSTETKQCQVSLIKKIFLEWFI